MNRYIERLTRRVTELKETTKYISYIYISLFRLTYKLTAYIYITSGPQAKDETIVSKVLVFVLN